MHDSITIFCSDGSIAHSFILKHTPYSFKNAFNYRAHGAFALVFIHTIKVKFMLSCVNTSPMTDLRDCVTAQS